MPRRQPPEVRRRAVELPRFREKPVAQIAVDLGISDSCLRGWMKQAGLLSVWLTSLTPGVFGREGCPYAEEVPS
jgi:hypothetical protein